MRHEQCPLRVVCWNFFCRDIIVVLDLVNCSKHRLTTITTTMLMLISMITTMMMMMMSVGMQRPMLVHITTTKLVRFFKV